jgi:hypothetical protein
MFACRLFSSKKTMLWSVLGSFVACAALPTNGFAIDKIATNARAVFTKAGGTTEYGLTQKQFQAAEAKISDAINRMARDRIIGGAVAPPPARKGDLSKKEKITYQEFLDYFRGLASEEDLKIRRALVDQALAQPGAAQAAADAAAAEAQRAAAIAEIASRDAQADRDLNAYDADADRIRRENFELELRNAELKWYLQHPNQVVPHPETNASNPQPTSGQNTPVQPPTIGRPTVHRPPVVTTNPPNPPRTGGGGPPGPKAAAPADSPTPKDDKKPDEKSKK